MSVYLNMKKVILVVFLFLIFIVNGNLFSQTVIKMKSGIPKNLDFEIRRAIRIKTTGKRKAK